MPWVKELKWVEDPELGEWGWMCADMPFSDYGNVSIGDGTVIAHDLIEHTHGPANIGGVIDELIAIGAVWFVRGRHGDMQRRASTSRHAPDMALAQEIAHVMETLIRYPESFCRRDVPRTQWHSDDETFKFCAEYAYRTLREDRDKDEMDILREIVGPRERVEEMIVSCMRRGYNLCRARFRHRGDYGPNNLFWAIAEEINDYTKRGHLEKDHEQHFKLHYGFEQHTGHTYARVEPIYREEEY